MYRNKKQSGTTQKTKNKIHVKTGDSVLIIAGKDKGKVATVKEVIPEDYKIVVEGVNLITKAVKANPAAGVQGGLIKMEAPIHSSNAMLYSIKAEKPTRIKKEVLSDGKKSRICKHTGEHLDV